MKDIVRARIIETATARGKTIMASDLVHTEIGYQLDMIGARYQMTRQHDS